MSELDPFSDKPSGNDHRVRNTIVGGALATLVILTVSGVMLKDRIGSIFSGSKISDVTPIPDPTSTPEARKLMDMVKTPTPDIATQVSEGLSLRTLPATIGAIVTIPATPTATTEPTAIPKPTDTATAIATVTEKAEPTATDTATPLPTDTATPGSTATVEPMSEVIPTDAIVTGNLTFDELEELRKSGDERSNFQYEPIDFSVNESNAFVAIEVNGVIVNYSIWATNILEGEEFQILVNNGGGYISLDNGIRLTLVDGNLVFLNEDGQVIDFPTYGKERPAIEIWEGNGKSAEYKVSWDDRQGGKVIMVDFRKE